MDMGQRWLGRLAWPVVLVVGFLLFSLIGPTAVRGSPVVLSGLVAVFVHLLRAADRRRAARPGVRDRR